MAEELKFEVVQQLGKIYEKGSTTKELNVVKWGENTPKFDLRVWTSKDGPKKPGKGITMTADEIQSLKALLDQMTES